MPGVSGVVGAFEVLHDEHLLAGTNQPQFAAGQFFDRGRVVLQASRFFPQPIVLRPLPLELAAQLVVAAARAWSMASRPRSPTMASTMTDQRQQHQRAAGDPAICLRDVLPAVATPAQRAPAIWVA